MLSNDELALKQMAIPDIIRKTKLIAKKPGVYELAADPLCGWRQLHDDLMGRVIIQSKKDFKGWPAETN
jgi:heme/copper-type cytochrome/quinol oxidase subunit 2